MKSRSTSPQYRRNSEISVPDSEIKGETQKDSIVLDPFLFARAMADAGFSMRSLSEKALIASNTLARIPDMKGIQPDNAKRVADLLQTKVTSLLAPIDYRYLPPSSPESLSEWEHDGYLSCGTLASNNLYFIPCRMKHLNVTGRGERFGRGKYYHLSLLRVSCRDDFRNKLARHADVCAIVGHHPNIPFNITCGPTRSGEGWWVIDDWVGGDNLEDLAMESGLSEHQAVPILVQVAAGLRALHDADVVMRELAPSHVLLNDDLSRAVVTDFELAKLLTDARSVSGSWKDDPFRAPEIIGTEATVGADLYSFARLAAFVFNGRKFRELPTESYFAEVTMPTRLRSLLMKCLDDDKRGRPKSIAPVIEEMTKWSEKVRATS